MKSTNSIVMAITAALIISCSATKNHQESNNPPSLDEMFTKMDSNNDGKLSFFEVQGPIKNDFIKLDSNSDGFITKEELQKAPKPQRHDGQRRPPHNR